MFALYFHFENNRGSGEALVAEEGGPGEGRGGGQQDPEVQEPAASGVGSQAA
jgi:hypothetical protein